MMSMSSTSAQDCCFISPSYFFFDDSERTGRNEHYYFTYFTQYDNSSTGTEYYEAGFFITNCILSCLLNSLIMFSLTIDELRNACNVFILNMTIADMLYGFIGPVMAVVRLNGDWNLGDLMCHLVFYIQSVCGCAVCWSIAGVSIDRYIHIVHPMRVHSAITAQQAGVIVAAIWVLSITMVLPIGIFFQVVERPIQHSINQTEIAHVCTLFWPLDTWYLCSIVAMTAVTFAVFILPVGLMIWCYSRCAKHMRTVSNTITLRMDSIESHSSVLDMKRRRSLREYRVIRTFMILLFVYVMAWGPLFSVFPVIVVDLYNKTTLMPSQAFVWTVALAQFNAVVNPLVYGLFMRNVRSNLLRRFRKVYY